MSAKWQGSKWIRAEKREAIYRRDNYTCVYCEKIIACDNRNELNLDHIICRNNGGNNKETNLVTACKSCNSARQDKTIENFATVAAIIRILHQITLPVVKIK